MKGEIESPLPAQPAVESPPSLPASAEISSNPPETQVNSSQSPPLPSLSETMALWAIARS